ARGCRAGCGADRARRDLSVAARHRRDRAAATTRGDRDDAAAGDADRRAGVRQRHRPADSGRREELSMIPFELSWRGGATEARLHRVRPGIDELPWGTLDLSRYPDAHGVEARKVWSNGVFTEYASAAAFSALTTAMLQCGAPVDLVAMS